MKPIQEIKNKIYEIKDLLADANERQICYQHNKAYLGVLILLSGITENDFDVMREGYSTFHVALKKAMKMGENMEKGLHNRQASMIQSKTEDEYQKWKAENK